MLVQKRIFTKLNIDFWDIHADITKKIEQIYLHRCFAGILVNSVAIEYVSEKNAKNRDNFEVSIVIVLTGEQLLPDEIIANVKILHISTQGIAVGCTDKHCIMIYTTPVLNLFSVNDLIPVAIKKSKCIPFANKISAVGYLAHAQSRQLHIMFPIDSDDAVSKFTHDVFVKCYDKYQQISNRDKIATMLIAKTTIFKGNSIDFFKLAQNYDLLTKEFKQMYWFVANKPPEVFATQKLPVNDAVAIHAKKKQVIEWLLNYFIRFFTQVIAIHEQFGDFENLTAKQKAYVEKF